MIRCGLRANRKNQASSNKGGRQQYDAWRERRGALASRKNTKRKPVENKDQKIKKNRAVRVRRPSFQFSTCGSLSSCLSLPSLSFSPSKPPVALQRAGLNRYAVCAVFFRRRAAFFPGVRFFVCAVSGFNGAVFLKPRKVFFSHLWRRCFFLRSFRVLFLAARVVRRVFLLPRFVCPLGWKKPPPPRRRKKSKKKVTERINQNKTLTLSAS